MEGMLCQFLHPGGWSLPGLFSQFSQKRNATWVCTTLITLQAAGCLVLTKVFSAIVNHPVGTLPTGRQQCQRSNMSWWFSCRCFEGVTSETKHLSISFDFLQIKNTFAVSNAAVMTHHQSPKDIILKASAQLLTHQYQETILELYI